MLGIISKWVFPNTCLISHALASFGLSYSLLSQLVMKIYCPSSNRLRRPWASPTPERFRIRRSRLWLRRMPWYLPRANSPMRVAGGTRGHQKSRRGRSLKRTLRRNTARGRTHRLRPRGQPTHPSTPSWRLTAGKQRLSKPPPSSPRPRQEKGTLMPNYPERLHSWWRSLWLPTITWWGLKGKHPTGAGPWPVTAKHKKRRWSSMEGRRIPTEKGGKLLLVTHIWCRAPQIKVHHKGNKLHHALIGGKHKRTVRE